MIYYLEADATNGVYEADEHDKLDPDPWKLENQELFFHDLHAPEHEYFVTGGYVDQEMYDRIDREFGITRR